QHVGRRLGIDIQNAFLLFFPEVRLELGPHSLGARGRAGEKLLVTVIWCDVGYDEPTHVGRCAPTSRCECTPWVLLRAFFDERGTCHWGLLQVKIFCGAGAHVREAAGWLELHLGLVPRLTFSVARVTVSADP